MALSAEIWSSLDTLSEPQFVPRRAEASFFQGGVEGGRIKVASLSSAYERQLPLRPPIVNVPRSGLGACDWTPDGARLIYIGVDGLLHIHDAKTGDTRPLTRRPLLLSGLTISPCGDQLAVVVNTQAVCLISLCDTEAELRVVNLTGDFVMDPAWSPDGRCLCWHEWDLPNMPWQSSRIMMRNLDQGSPLIVVNEGCAVGQPRFSPDGRHLGFLSDRRGWMTLWACEINSIGGAPAFHLLASDQAEHAPPSWGPGLRTWAWIDPDTLVIWRNEHGAGALERWSHGRCVERVLDGVAHSVSVRDGALLAVMGNPERTDKLLHADAEARTVLARSGPAVVDQYGLAPQNVSWTSDGHQINARLYPTSETSLQAPRLIVWIHEGPTGQALSVINPRIHYFTERGWSVLVPDYRGSTGRGRDFMMSLFGQWGEADAADVAAGAEFAIQQGLATPERLVFYGGSAGGFLTLRLLQTRPDLCAAGVALFPVCHLCDDTTKPWRYQTHYVEQLVEANKAARSPLENAERTGRPVLVLHGTDDHIVPAWHCKAFVDAVQAAGGDAERIEYDGQGHGWSCGPSLTDELVRIEHFLGRVIG